MDLSYSKYLKELPNLSTATNLRELDLSRCSSLVELPSSIGNMTNLVKLNLFGCSKLKALPININMKSLDELDLRYCSSMKRNCSMGQGNVLSRDTSNPRCSNLQKLRSSIGNLTNLENLDLFRCSSLVELPSSIGNLRNLKKLNLRGCSKLMALPVNINMKYLDNLDLSYCSSLK
ncbi:unnamed protein product, partial [Brassica rapa subsp. trilocularis]